MKFISVLLLLLILICCKSKNEPYTIFDAKGHKVKEVFGEMDSIVYYKRDSLLSFKKRNDGLYHAKIFLNGNLNSEGAGQLKKNNFLRTGWWNSYQADTVSQNEYLIIQGEDYLNQSKTYYLDRLLDEKSLYFTTEITENNKDSLIVQFNFYPPKTETRNNYLCIIQDDFDGFDNLYQSRIDTIPMLYAFVENCDSKRQIY